jgi:co-chaperonin GroES (HSP10)
MSKVNYECLEDRILVIPVKGKEESKKSGSIITDMKKRQTIECEVVNVGLGRHAPETGTFIATVLAKSDIVLCGLNDTVPMGLEIDLPNENGDIVSHYLLREGDILCKLSKKE